MGEDVGECKVRHGGCGVGGPNSRGEHMNANIDTPHDDSSARRAGSADGASPRDTSRDTSRETPRETPRIPGDRRVGKTPDRRNDGPPDRRGRGLDVYRLARPPQ
jgi:hypothetical protein